MSIKKSLLIVLTILNVTGYSQEIPKSSVKPAPHQ
jgi:hypothetical protein